MEILRVVRMGFLAIIAVVAIGFAVLNPAERVSIDLFFVPILEEVPLVFTLFCAFLIGIIGGLSVAMLSVLELQTKLRFAKRSRHDIEGELTTLRNLPLEDDDPDSGGEGTS